MFPVGQLSDDENEVESDDEEEEEDVAAEEYDAVSGEIGGDSEQDEDEEDDEVSEASGGGLPRYEEFKWQRVERVKNEVREFGEEIIDVEELASVYDFRIDKFQVFRCLRVIFQIIFA